MGAENCSNQKEKRGILIAVIALVTAVVLAAGALTVQTSMRIQERNRRIESVQAAIDSLGKISMESLQAIDDAEKMLSNLPEQEQEQIENRDTLADARKEYHRLEGKIQAALDALDAVKTPITVDSKDSIDKARAAFDDLKADNLSEYVEEEAEILANFEALWADEYALSQLSSGEELRNQGQYEDAMKAFYDVMDNYPSREAEAKEHAAATIATWAQVCYDAKDYEATHSRLTEAKDRDLGSDALTAIEKKLNKKLDSLRPQNGKTIKKTINWGYGGFKVTAGDQDICYKLENLDNPEKYAIVYVRRNESATIKVKDGRYVMKYTLGDIWFGNEQMFGLNAQYAKISESVEYKTTYSGSWVYYSTQSIDLSKHAIGDWGIPAISRSEW